MTESCQRVYIVDDDASFRKSIERLLRSSGFQTTCYESAVDFVAQHSSHAEGCLLADLRMPEMDGLALQQHLARSANPVPIIFLTGQGDIRSGVEAMRYGAEDFLEKTASKEAIIAAVERALNRDSIERSARSHREDFKARMERLTNREIEVLAHVLRGHLNKQIAADLNICERSVKRHRTNLMHKLAVKSVAELVQLVLDSEVSLPPS